MAQPPPSRYDDTEMNKCLLICSAFFTKASFSLSLFLSLSLSLFLSLSRFLCKTCLVIATGYLVVVVIQPTFAQSARRHQCTEENISAKMLTH